MEKMSTLCYRYIQYNIQYSIATYSIIMCAKPREFCLVQENIKEKKKMKFLLKQ